MHLWKNTQNIVFDDRDFLRIPKQDRLRVGKSVCINPVPRLQETHKRHTPKSTWISWQSRPVTDPELERRNKRGKTGARQGEDRMKLKSHLIFTLYTIYGILLKGEPGTGGAYVRELSMCVMCIRACSRPTAGQDKPSPLHIHTHTHSQIELLIHMCYTCLCACAYTVYVCWMDARLSENARQLEKKACPITARLARISCFHKCMHWARVLNPSAKA